MKPSKLILSGALVCGLAVPAFADLSILDNNKTLKVDCAKDAKVDLIGNHITVTLDGTCAKVTVTGNHASVTGSATKVFVAGNNNKLSIDGADDIAIAGNKNALTWKRGLKAANPKVANTGKDNAITQAK